MTKDLTEGRLTAPAFFHAFLGASDPRAVRGGAVSASVACNMANYSVWRVLYLSYPPRLESTEDIPSGLVIRKNTVVFRPGPAAARNATSPPQ